MHDHDPLRLKSEAAGKQMHQTPNQQACADEQHQRERDLAHDQEALRRRTEIGIRMALGAPPASVVRLVLWRVSMLVGTGVMVGTVLSVLATRFVATLLYGLEPRDPITLVASAVVLATVGTLAEWLPAHRASCI